MKKIWLLCLSTLMLASCVKAPVEKNVISLFNDQSRLFTDSLEDDKSHLLKTYHHQSYGEVPYVLIDEFCDTFPVTDIRVKRKYEIKDKKFYIYTDDDDIAMIIDAKTDKITTSKEVINLFTENNRTNNKIPLDLFALSDKENFAKESTKTRYINPGEERVYDCKKYNFDIVYEDGKYYAPFTLLSYIFYGFKNTTFIYNGKNYFDCDCIAGSFTTIASYCYSSKGNFLLDRSGGKLGAVMFNNVAPKEANEAYRFENIIESSKQLTVFSLLNDGTGTLTTYDENNVLIDEGVYIKVKYQVNDAKTELFMDYYSVLELTDDEPISEITKLRINLDETYFNKQTRSKEIAEATYQELRFAFYELYGDTTNTSIKDFDNFIKDKDYKDDLLSLDIQKYDDAMAKLLLIGVDDAHTTIEFPSIFDKPTFANANGYSVRYEGERRKYITSTLISYRNQRKEKGLSEGLDIVNKTAFISFDSFSYSRDIKAFSEYKDTDPHDYVESSMELFASSFNKIKENKDVQNVVIDVTCNGGGKVASMSYLIAYLTNDPSIITNLKLNNSLIEYHYEVDLDQDGIYASENDTFKGKYNFYILTSDSSFSCANLTSATCRNNNLATIIGDRSAGGACIISYLCNSSGYIYRSSSEYVLMSKNGDTYVNNDSGIEPDIKIESKYYFDHQYLDELLSK